MSFGLEKTIDAGGPKKRLTLRLVRYTVAIALLLGVLSSAIGMLSDYRSRDRALDESGVQLLDSVEKAATHVVWNIDLEGGRELALGLLKYGSVFSVEILDEGGYVLTLVERQDQVSVSRAFRGLLGGYRIYERSLRSPLVSAKDSEGRPLGKVLLTLDPVVEAGEFVRHAALAAWLELLRSLALAGALLYVFHLQVTRGLLQVGTALAGIDPKNPARGLIEAPQGHRDDELGHLVEKSNVLLQAVGANIGRREQAEEALRLALRDAEESRDRVDTILRSIADGLIVTDLDNRIVMANRRAQEMLGFTFSDETPVSIAAAIPERRLIEPLESILAGDLTEASAEWELPGDTKEGKRVVQARIALVPILEGMGKGVITTLRDVTRERASDRMKSEFISIAAHELNTPLTVVMGYAELLKENMEAEPLDLDLCKEFLATIYHKAEVVSHIVDDLLDLSRIESGQTMFLETETSDLYRVLREVVEQFIRKYPERRIEMDLEPASVWALVDPMKIEQVWQNLISNALKYSPEGGPVRVSGRLEKEVVRFAVEDQGIGMTQANIECMFDKFYRADTLNTAVGGLGLGMSIVKSILDAHGGGIEVRSSLGEGTTVSFTLPLGQKDDLSAQG